MIYIGTCGFYYKNAAGSFYPENLSPSSYFKFYCSKFNTLELNSSFYRKINLENIRSWNYRLNKLDDFKLSVKAHRLITHTYKLKNTEEVKNFINIVKNLKKIGIVLFQLPHSLKYDIELLVDFTKHLDTTLKYAIEFRNDSWYRIETYTHLKNKNIAMVWHDYNGNINYEKTADFIYIRLHGFKGKFKGSYPDIFLEELAGKIDRQCYIYFNNTEDKSAFADAERMKRFIK